jgi:hypothetical protein
VLDRFWEGAGHQFGERFLVRALGPALLFWIGMFLAYYRRLGFAPIDRAAPDKWDTWLVFGTIAAILLIAASAAAIEPVVLPALRLLEGYALPNGRLRAAFVRRQLDRARALAERWRTLAEMGLDQLSAPQREEYAALDLELRRIPRDPALVMPSRLGNILRAAEHRPEARYGLSTMVCWPYLWLLLPDDARKELSDARERLDNAVRGFIFSILFTGCGCLAIWPIPVGLFAAFVSYLLTLTPAEVYGDLVFAAFTLYRVRLYRAMRWVAPISPHDERAYGEQLSLYLFRGIVNGPMRFSDERGSVEAPTGEAAL